MNGFPTTLGHALLGLIAQQPRTGYALQQVFRTTPMGHYSGSPGAIYPALRTLALKKLVSSRNAAGPGARRPRRIYRLTTAGKKALKLWLRSPPSREDVVWRLEELMLRFAFMEGVLEPTGVIPFVATLRQEILRYVAALETHRDSPEGPRSVHGRLALDAGIRGYRTQADWATTALRKLRRSIRNNH